jgi:hypothetical protein
MIRIQVKLSDEIYRTRWIVQICRLNIHNINEYSRSDEEKSVSIEVSNNVFLFKNIISISSKEDFRHQLFNDQLLFFLSMEKQLSMLLLETLSQDFLYVWNS